MTGIGEHAYFQAIEEAFIRLRGAPLLLSPADWQVASEWHREGIPLDLVVGTLEEVFARRTEREERRNVQTLRYCRRAVERAWRKRREVTSTGVRREPPKMDLAEVLAALADAIPDSVPEAEELAMRIRALEGGSETVERQLAELDREMVAAVDEALDEGSSARLSQAVEEAVERLAARLPPEETEEARSRLRHQILRRRAGLPVLSLFAGSPAQD